MFCKKSLLKISSFYYQLSLSKDDSSDYLRLVFRYTETIETCKPILSFQQAKISPDFPTPSLHFSKLSIPWGFLFILLS